MIGQVIGLVLALIALVSCGPARALVDDALLETRQCAVVRDEAGRIVRRADVVRAFRRIHPCPATGQTSGACPGWSADHVLPLVCGGCDAVRNVQWLPNIIKSAPGSIAKDRWEQRAYCHPQLLTSMPTN